MYDISGFNYSENLKPLSTKENKKILYYIAKFGVLLDIVKNNDEFDRMNDRDKLRTIKAMAVENLEELNAEINRLMRIFPELLRTSYVNDLMRLASRYRDLLRQCEKDKRENVKDITKHYAKRSEILDEINSNRCAYV